MRKSPGARRVKTMAEFDEELAKFNLIGQWQDDALLESLVGGTKPQGDPYIWQWKTLNEKLLEACEVMPESNTARRNLSLLNPGLQKRGTSNNIIMGMQMVMPGEVAWAHRHPIAAMRFSIEGDKDLYTVVDGEKLPMEPNDLVLTPAWTWHDHHNESKRNGIWLDVLDVPLIGGLGQITFEKYGNTTQTLREYEFDYISHRTGYMRPLWEHMPQRNFPCRFAWRDVEQQLAKLADGPGSPYDDVILEYVNPVTGGPALPTMRCTVQELRPGFLGKAHRHTSSAVYYVIEGEGKTIVDGVELAWSERDVFVIPNWSEHRHLNGSKTRPARLFSVTDAPLLEYIGIQREEPERTVHSRSVPAIPVRKTVA